MKDEKNTIFNEDENSGVDTAENGHPDRSAHASAPPLSKTALCLPMHLFTMQHGLDGAVLDVPEDVLGLCSFLAGADLEPFLEPLEARARDDARAQQVERCPEPGF